MRPPGSRSVPDLVSPVSLDRSTTDDTGSLVAPMTNLQTQAARTPGDRFPISVASYAARETQHQPTRSARRIRRANDHLRRRRRDTDGDRQRVRTRTARLLE